MKRKGLLAIVVGVVFALAGGAWGAPRLLHYQGRLVDAAGDPVTTDTQVTFTFHDDAETTEPLGGFVDTDVVTPNAEGLYATIVGDDPTSPIPVEIFGQAVVWLNVAINGEDLRPRKRIVSAPYALLADHATTAAFADLAGDAQALGGVDRDGFATALHDHPNLMVRAIYDPEADGQVVSAERANTANFADVATSSTFADQATSAALADHADLATTAAFAVRSAFATRADDATTAGFADRSTTASFADALTTPPSISPPLYEAVVAPSGGDYTSVEAALAAGAKSIFVRNGAYTLADNASITTDGVSIVGESPGGVVIDCGSFYFGATAPGEGAMAGELVSVSDGETEVGGSLTAWLTSAEVGQYLLLGDNWYRIASIDSDTSITLETPYRGEDLAGAFYAISGMFNDIRLENLTFQDSSYVNGAVILRGLRNGRVSNCAIRGDDSVNGFAVSYVNGLLLSGCVVEGKDNGIRVDYATNSAFHNNQSLGNARRGFYCFDSHSIEVTDSVMSYNPWKGIEGIRVNNAIIRGVTAKYNGSEGIYASLCINGVIEANVCQNNDTQGIDLPNCDRIVVKGNQLNRNGDVGLHVNGGTANVLTDNTCQENDSSGLILAGDSFVVTGNSLLDNGGYGIFLLATTCSVTGNMCKGNLEGIYVTGSENAIVGNSVIANDVHGIAVQATAGDNVVANNIVTNNPSGNADLSASTHKSNNHPAF